ncbi:glycosyltransferase [Microbacterium sp. YJN-G]|uniref:glycosyltransferase n=1 Tax=Microbacterium sp. YJN-G TaxID=2763257 RepID=UPI001878B140|nr:glycosyltransferase [Microbacterium sp. YJN-G]
MTAEHLRSAAENSAPSRRIVSVSKYIPYPSITHAGGQYVGQHVSALARLADVELLAPETPLNRHALTQFRGEASVRLLRGVGPGGDGRFKTVFDVESAWRGSAVAWPYRRLFQTSRGPWPQLATADLIEFHWSEMIAVAPSVRNRLPGTPLVGVAHDVITQRWERASAAAGNKLAGLAYAAAARRSRSQEQSSFQALDAVLVFSDKDAALAREFAPKTRIEVVHPGLGPAEVLDRAVDIDEPVVLFTGALNRPDNESGMLWFLQRVWPDVIGAVPSARLVIAGANPRPALARAVERAPRAVLTGFVDSLEPWYARAAVFVAPLRTGAGVKFKTIDAMLRGAPVVATKVGAEGIDASSLFAGITDEPGEFARAVIAELRHPDARRTAEAQRWAEGVYGATAFEKRLHTLYAGLLPGR